MIGTLLVAFQEKIIFLPTTLEQDFQFEFDTPFEEIFLQASDGAKLNGLHFKVESPKGVILYFHGNAGDLSRWGNIVEPFTEFNYDVVVMDYRSYGKSTGRLSEKNLYEDAQLFYDYVSSRYEEDEIVIYGRSLGTGIASKIASTNTAKLLMLETPYTSIVDVGKHRFPIFPVSSFLNYKLPSIDYLKTVKIPVIIFHGTDDDVVPYKFGKQLHESKVHTAELITIEGGQHNNLSEFDAYWKEIKSLLN